MKIELKRLSISPRLSQETTAFAADVWIDGKKAGYAENDGRGGCTNVHIQPRELAERVEAYGKAVVPAEYKFIGGAEWLVDQLVEAELQRRHDAREAKRIAKYDSHRLHGGVVVARRKSFWVPREIDRHPHPIAPSDMDHIVTAYLYDRDLRTALNLAEEMMKYYTHDKRERYDVEQNYKYWRGVWGTILVLAPPDRKKAKVPRAAA